MRTSLRTAAAGAALSLTLALPAGSAIIDVTSTADDLGDGPNGNCTLREAIVAANTDAAVDACTPGGGADTVRVPAGTYTLSRIGPAEDAAATGDLDVRGDLILSGAGRETTILESGGSTNQTGDRLLDVEGPGEVEIRDVTIRGGLVFVESFDGEPMGGALRAVGARVTIRRTAILGSACKVLSYGMSCDGGAVGAKGGELAIRDSLLEGNQATIGGAVAVTSTSATIMRSVVRENRAGAGFGGGIYVGDGASSLELAETAVVDNIAAAPVCPGTCFPGSTGGGIYSAGALVVSNSTIARNWCELGFLPQAPPGAGVRSTGSLVLSHSTVAGNVRYGWPINGPDGVARGGSGAALLQSSILADPCTGGGFTSGGFNVAAGDTCGLADPTDLPSTDPHLGAALLERQGTWVYPPALTSPAVDSGDPGDCPATDQRGAPRPLDGDANGAAVCDRGAVETPSGPDSDGDLYADELDSCPAVANPDQTDEDLDGIGDLCDPCVDRDEDGWGDPASPGCAHPELDCRDDAAAINPGATEVPRNQHDDDCNPATLDCEDQDGDGFYYPVSDVCGFEPEDCQDNDATVNPGMTEVVGNGKNDDCRSTTSDCPDADGDLFETSEGLCPGADCDDANPAVNPAAPEIPGNGIDDDCNPGTPWACIGPEAATARGLGPESQPLGDVGGLAMGAGAVFAALRINRRSRPGR